MDFQEELKQNLRSAETVQREAIQQETERIMEKAKNSLSDIKHRLLENAKYARTETKDGVTSVCCFYELPNSYMSVQSTDNNEQIRKDRQKLFHDPNLKYHTWVYYNVSPKHSREYYEYISALKELAEAEKISIEPVVYNSERKQMATFPTTLKDPYFFGWRLCVRATSVISVDENYKPEQSAATTSQKPPVQDVTPKEETFSAKDEKDDNTKIFMCLLILMGIGVAAYALSIADISEMGKGLCWLLLFVGIIFVYKILSKK